MKVERFMNHLIFINLLRFMNFSKFMNVLRSTNLSRFINLSNRDSDSLNHSKDSFRFIESESDLPNTSADWACTYS